MKANVRFFVTVGARRAIDIVMAHNLILPITVEPVGKEVAAFNEKRLVPVFQAEIDIDDGQQGFRVRSYAARACRSTRLVVVAAGKIKI